MSKKLWGGRFTKGTHPLVEDFTCSLSYDYRLAKYDCLGSIAHAKMLGERKIVPLADVQKIVKGLEEILKEINSEDFKIDLTAEDIHTVIQNALEHKIGEAALKLHTARSRNDQVSLDMRMYCKEAIEEIISLIGKFQDAISDFAKQYDEIVLPGYTHLQHAQPVLLRDYLFAYIEMCNRDKERLADAFKRCDTLPLGSCALAGTSLPIDRKYVAKLLGFSRIATSTIDAVSDRDFVIEVLNCLAIIGVHLSRLAEDFIIYSTNEFDFFEIDDEFCTGSSLMPQKKNPDVLELIRGYASKLLGNYISVASLMKNLPLAYNRDMQLDKEPLFNSLDIIKNELRILPELIKSVKVNKDKIDQRVNDEALYATDLADYLVKQGVAFKEAHSIVGKLIKFSLDKKKEIKTMSQVELEKFSDKLTVKDVRGMFNPAKSAKSREK